MSNDLFTFDMFGSSALSSGLGLGVTAFGGFSPHAANDDDPDPIPPAPAPALPVAATPGRRAGLRPNFYFDGDRELGATWKVEPARMSRQSSSLTALPSRTGRQRPRSKRS
jgi:hypothetical protein